MPRIALIGGSAGSLTALQDLFMALPVECGVSYIVIQHLSPQHHSQMDSVLSRWTEMPVQLVSKPTQIQPDQVYIAAPGFHMKISGSMLHPVRCTQTIEQHRPIDFFCHTLAQKGPDAALVILSGTGHDGTEGAKEIKNNLGVVFAQDPGYAAFESMPLSVVDAGLADRALPPEEIARALCMWGKTGKLEKLAEEEGPAHDTFEAVLELLRTREQMDMSGYKRTTLRRRIERRMGFRHAANLKEYLQILRDSPDELEQLSKDLLIGVTSFFRDPEAFQQLEREVVPNICGAKDDREAVRVWVAGCSTGEEAYSIAILLMEWFLAQGKLPQIQIFATDIDEIALEIGRAGIYTREELKGVSEERIGRFFKKEKSGYRIDKSVRETIVFAAHNLILDPPFSRLDLVICRNLLIYLNSGTQKKLLNLFHFVLNPGGYLFLGSSESIGSIGKHFHALSKQWRIYQQLPSEGERPPPRPLVAAGAGARKYSGIAESMAEIGAFAGQERIYRELVETYGPTQVLVNSSHEILFVSGGTSPFLSVPAGPITHNLFKMVHPALAMALRSAVGDAAKNRSKTSVSTSMTDSEGRPASVRIEVTPVSAEEKQAILLVCFTLEAASSSCLPVPGSQGEDWVMKQLLQELNATREDLQRTIEQSRISAEEMKAANEEVMAMNEELQSANEELESSKEELQSLNEELVTSNASLDAKVIEVQSLNSDLGNLLNSTETATLLLDEKLRIRRFTPACASLMKIIKSDLGRSIGDVVQLFKDPSLAEDCSKVMKKISVKPIEIRDQEGRWYLRRILPYQGVEGGISGVVLTFPEITTIKEAELLLHERAKILQWQANLLSRAAPVVGRNLQDQVIFWNMGATELYGWTEEEALGKVTHDLLQTRFGMPLDRIRSDLMENSVWKGELEHVTKSGRKIVVDSQWTTYRDESGNVQAIVEVNNDITERVVAQKALKESESRFHTMLDWTYNWEYWVGPNEKFIYMTPAVERVTGYKPKEFEENPGLIDAIVFPEDAPAWERHIFHHLKKSSDSLGEMEFRIVRKNGEIRWISHICRPVIDQEGINLGRRVTVRDITQQKLAEEKIRELAYYDPLTRLPNRRLLLDRLGQALLGTRRSRQYGALMMLDMDHFKSINDSQGHDAGDQMLIEVASRLAAHVRQEDTISRLGGDEFVVILEDLGTVEHAAIHEAEVVAEKIRAALSLPYFLGKEESCYSSCSIGLTVFLDHEDSAEVLLKQVDVALYQAKDAGRNAIRFFNQDMQAKIDIRAKLEAALHRGLEKNEFRVFYQPQVNREGDLIGAEALIRWFPDSGMVSPAEFIPVAEESGLILQIGQWMLDSVCRQLKLWENDASFGRISIAVNVSSRQLHQPDFVESVKRSLGTSGADPNRLKLELTESVVLNGIETVVERMGQLAEMGVSFSLDDFGTGYSSLLYLKRLPLSQVKVDQSFVRAVTEDPNDAAIVRAILAMSESLGLEAIAEGVETEAQREFLFGNGCAAYQGYLFGKPMPLEEWSVFFEAS